MANENGVMKQLVAVVVDFVQLPGVEPSELSAELPTVTAGDIFDGDACCCLDDDHIGPCCLGTLPQAAGHLEPCGACGDLVRAQSLTQARRTS